MTLVDSLLSVLGSETRLAIFRALGTEGLPVSEVARRVGRSPSAVQRHLRLLQGVGLVYATDRGTGALYKWTSTRIDVIRRRVRGPMVQEQANPPSTGHAASLHRPR